MTEISTPPGSQKGPLLYLWEIAAHGAGYEVHGVWGWAHLRDIEEGTNRALPDKLPPMFQGGYLDREDARDPTRAGPVWVYRITQRGIHAVREAYEGTYGAVPTLCVSKSKPGAYLPPRHRAALLVLRAACDDPARPTRFGERGWLSARDLAAQMELPPSSASASLQYLAAAFLHRKGLAERCIEPAPPGQQAGRTYWRATELGRGLPLLEWKPMPEFPSPRPPSSEGAASRVIHPRK